MLLKKKWFRKWKLQNFEIFFKNFKKKLKKPLCLFSDGLKRGFVVSEAFRTTNHKRQNFKIWLKRDIRSDLWCLEWTSEITLCHHCRCSPAVERELQECWRCNQNYISSSNEDEAPLLEFCPPPDCGYLIELWILQVGMNNLIWYTNQS
jgi:hypothetical protein